MKRMRLKTDIKPLSEFRSNAASIIAQVRKTGRPVLITQHGKGTAVLINIENFDEFLDKNELMRDLDQSEKEITEGKVIPHEVVIKELQGLLNKMRK